MRKLIYILLFIIPLLNFGQVPDLLQLANWQQANSINYYTIDNSARPTPDEVDATTGMSSLSNSTFSSVSVSPSPFNGTHSIKITVTTVGTASESLLTITGLTNGATYLIKLHLNKFNSGNWAINFDTFRGWTAASSESFAGFSANVWNAKEYTKTTNSTTGIIRFYSSTAGGGEVSLNIDNIIITEL